MNDRSKLSMPKGCLWGAVLTIPIWLVILYLIFR